jgi:small subunit ribosomal protein S35
LGDNHPSDRKVVVQFAPDDLGLTPIQSSKLKKLAGSRYNPDTEIIKMSSDSFQHAAQNKAYLSNLVDDLITAAKDPKDTFEDIPLDTRHNIKKPKPKFPTEWLMNEERKRALEGTWERAMLEDSKKADAGQLVDGEQKIQRFLAEKLAEQQRQLLEQERAAELLNVAPVGGPRSRAKGNRLTR